MIMHQCDSCGEIVSDPLKLYSPPTAYEDDEKTQHFCDWYCMMNYWTQFVGKDLNKVMQRMEKVKECLKSSNQT